MIHIHVSLGSDCAQAHLFESTNPACWSNAHTAMPRDGNTEQDNARSRKATRVLPFASTPAVTPRHLCCKPHCKRVHICSFKVCCHGSERQSKEAPAIRGGCCRRSLFSQGCPDSTVDKPPSYLKELMPWRCHRELHRAPHTHTRVLKF